MRCLHLRRTVAAEFRAQIVYGDEEDVGLLGGGQGKCEAEQDGENGSDDVNGFYDYLLLTGFGKVERTCDSKNVIEGVGVRKATAEIMARCFPAQYQLWW
jgi:hypothetical protein